MPGSSASATPSTRNWRTVRRIMFAVFALLGVAALIYAIAGSGPKPSSDAAGATPSGSASSTSGGKVSGSSVTGSSGPICNLLKPSDIKADFGEEPNNQSDRTGNALTCDYGFASDQNKAVSVSLNCAKGDANTQGSAENWWAAYDTDITGSVPGAKKATNDQWTGAGVRLKGGCLLAVYRTDKSDNGLAHALKTAYDNEMSLKVRPEGTDNLPLPF